MPDEHYVNTRLAAIYDIECGWPEDRDFYLRLAEKRPLDILDIGCGTGQLAKAYAQNGHRVMGADPAPAMLDIARKGASGQDVDWVGATAQALTADRRFDLAVMTGHAFQVLLDEGDVAACFENVRNLLKHDGRFVFETRNPAIDWVTRWTQDYRLDTPFGAVAVVRRVDKRAGDRIWFTTDYTFEDGNFVSESELRFWTEAEIRSLAKTAGLSAHLLYGDWQGRPFDAALSDEMVFELTIAENRAPVADK